MKMRQALISLHKWKLSFTLSWPGLKPMVAVFIGSPAQHGRSPAALCFCIFWSSIIPFFFFFFLKVVNVWCIFECLTSNDCGSVFLCLVQCSNYHWVCCVVVIIVVFGCCFGWSLLKRLHFFFYLKRWLSRWQYSAQCLLCVCFIFLSKEMVVKMAILSTVFIVCVFHFFYLKRWLSRWQYSAQCLLCVCFIFLSKEMVVKMAILSTVFIVCVFHFFI